MPKDLKALEKAPNVAYDDALKHSHKVRCVKGHTATRSNLVVPWKITHIVVIIT